MCHTNQKITSKTMLIMLSFSVELFLRSQFFSLALSLSHSLSLFHFHLVSLSPHLMLPSNEKWGQCNLFYCPAGLPSPQQQQIKSEQHWANRQKFTPLSLSISATVDDNPDLPFPLVSKAPVPPVHFNTIGFHCDFYWQLNLQMCAVVVLVSSSAISPAQAQLKKTKKYLDT